MSSLGIRGPGLREDSTESTLQKSNVRTFTPSVLWGWGSLPVNLPTQGFTNNGPGPNDQGSKSWIDCESLMNVSKRFGVKGIDTVSLLFRWLSSISDSE